MRAETHLRWGAFAVASAVIGALWARSARADEARLLALDRMASAPEDDSLVEAYMDRMFATADAMQLIPADSLAGVAAKARVTGSHCRDNTESDTLSRLQPDALDELLTLIAPRNSTCTERASA